VEVPVDPRVDDPREDVHELLFVGLGVRIRRAPPGRHALDVQADAHETRGASDGASEREALVAGGIGIVLLGDVG
jgi:hypothetical protein